MGNRVTGELKQVTIVKLPRFAIGRPLTIGHLALCAEAPLQGLGVSMGYTYFSPNPKLSGVLLFLTAKNDTCG
jgi:hypothetical protein